MALSAAEESILSMAPFTVYMSFEEIGESNDGLVSEKIMANKSWGWMFRFFAQLFYDGNDSGAKRGSSINSHEGVLESINSLISTFASRW